VASRLRRRIDKNFVNWIEKRLPALDSVTLNQSRIFIVPTRQGLVLIFIALLVLLMAINFESALNYALGFWLISMMWVAVHLTYRNLSGLSIGRLNGNLVQVGDIAEVRLLLKSSSATNRGVLEFIHEEWGSVQVLMSDRESTVILPLKAYSRGKIEPPRFKIESRFPFGLIVAWSHIQISAQAWAYPEGIQFDRKSTSTDEEDENESKNDHFYRPGSEDFHSLKPYVPGDSIRRIYWPGFSRDLVLVKAFSDYQSSDVIIDWDSFQGVADELRLSAIAFYSQQYHDNDVPYGIRLPGVGIEPDKGIEHLTRVRQALAEHGFD
jgi:uncharacterized protein (DUF58 family)